MFGDWFFAAWFGSDRWTRSLLANSRHCERGATTNCCSISPRLVNTGVQALRTGWRNKRTRLYHGLSSPLIIQRQDGIIGNNVQAGVPIAPDMCTVAFPTEITKSNAAILAAKLSMSISGSPCSNHAVRHQTVRGFPRHHYSHHHTASSQTVRREC